MRRPFQPGVGLGLELCPQRCDVLCVCRKEAEIVLNYERSRMEARRLPTVSA